jgi:hypothetical protein
MRPRTTLALIVIAIVSLFAGWEFGLRTEPPGQASVAPGTLAFPGLAEKLQTASRVEITHQRQTLAITNVGGKWGLPDRGGYPVLQDRLRELLTGLTELRITEPRTSNPTEYARLGVEDPQSPTADSNLLQVFDNSGAKIAEMIVGHRRMRTQGNLPEAVYIRRPGEAQSWLAEGSLPVDADPQLWLARDIINIDHSKIASVTVHRGDETLVFGKDGDKFVLQSPTDHPKLDDYKVEDVGRGLEQVTLTDVKPIAQEPGTRTGTADIATTDGMKITVTVFMNNKDVWAQFAVSGDGASKKAADALQTAIGGWAYQLGSWKEQSFIPTMDELKADTPATPAAPTPAPPSMPAP